MAKQQKFPGADAVTQWFQDNFPGNPMDTNCGVIHTTETTTWPAYVRDGKAGATAPNFTTLPVISAKRLSWRQHFDVDRSSRALRNLSGGVETNTLNVVQLELIGTCDPTKRTSWGTKKAGVDYIFWPTAPDWALAELAKILAWLNTEHGVPIASPRPSRWQAFPDSYGPGDNRLTGAEWSALKGWVGHQHVPENSHGDPGAFDWPTLATKAKLIVNPPPVVVPPPVKPPAVTTRPRDVQAGKVGTAEVPALLLQPGVATQVLASLPVKAGDIISLGSKINFVPGLDGVLDLWFSRPAPDTAGGVIKPDNGTWDDQFDIVPRIGKKTHTMPFLKVEAAGEVKAWAKWVPADGVTPMKVLLDQTKFWRESPSL